MTPSGRGQTVQVAPFYRLLLGRGFESLPAPIRQLHDVSGETIARGRCHVRRGEHPLSRLAGRIFGLPPAGENLPVKVRFLPQAGGERWYRRFGTHRLASYQVPAGRPGWMFESFGPGRFLIELAAGRGQSTMNGANAGRPVAVDLFAQGDVHAHVQKRVCFSFKLFHSLHRQTETERETDRQRVDRDGQR